MTTQRAPLDTSALVRSGAELAEGAQARWSWARGLVLGDTSTSQFIRYAFVGAVTSALYGLVFFLLDGSGDMVANVVGMIVSTIAANELHRRLTFHAAGRKAWLPAQVESGGLAVVALVATTVALGVANRVVPTAPWTVEVTLVLAVTGLIGIVKFFALRGLVFGSTR